MRFVLLALIGVAVAVGLGLLVAMLRRDKPHFGVVGLMILQGAGVPAAVYATLYV